MGSEKRVGVCGSCRTIRLFCSSFRTNINVSFCSAICCLFFILHAALRLSRVRHVGQLIKHRGFQTGGEHCHPLLATRGKPLRGQLEHVSGRQGNGRLLAAPSRRLRLGRADAGLGVEAEDLVGGSSGAQQADPRGHFAAGRRGVLDVHPDRDEGRVLGNGSREVLSLQLSGEWHRTGEMSLFVRNVAESLGLNRDDDDPGRST